MPFTISHAVAVLPVARNRRLVPAALVIGSCVPDLPYFVPFLGHSDWTHAASGPVTIDLLLGLLVLALWQLFLRRPLVALAPDRVRERVPSPRRLDRDHLVGAAASVVLGAVTHVAWDTFTHPGRWGTTHLPALAEALGPLPVHKWLQFASGGLGLVGLLIWVVLRLHGTPRRPDPPGVRPAVRRVAWAGVSVVAVLVAACAGVGAWVDSGSFEVTAVTAVTRSMGATAASVFLVCLLWHVSDRRQSSGTRP